MYYYNISTCVTKTAVLDLLLTRTAVMIFLVKELNHFLHIRKISFACGSVEFKETLKSLALT